jgi:hypothetical protein
MVIAAVEQRDPDGPTGERAGSVETTEATAHHHDMRKSHP